MKTFKLFALLLTALAVMTFTSCSDDDENENLVTIDFENVQLPANGYTDSLKYEAQGISFYNQFSDWGNGSTSWEGFSYSKLTDKTTPGLANQYSVYGTGGAANSKIFAIAYAGFNETTHFKFGKSEAYTLKSVMANTTTYTTLSIKNGDSYAKKFESGDWFKVIFTGYNVNGTKASTYEYYLADFRNNKSYICEQWTEINLQSLGKVNKVEITFDSSDKGDYINTPQYVCLDNLTYIVE